MFIAKDMNVEYQGKDHNTQGYRTTFTKREGSESESKEL